MAEPNRLAVKRYRKTLKGCYASYKSAALRRGIAFKLTLEQFATFWMKDCYWCGYRIRTVGIDRLNNKKEYSLKTCVPCCLYCNRGKSDMTPAQWVALCSNVVRKHGGLIYAAV